MSVQLTCSRGHSWESTGDFAPCPVCAETVTGTPTRVAHSVVPVTEERQAGEPGAAAKTYAADGPPHGAALTAQPPGVAAPPDIPGYEVLGVLGYGGMGVVYRARQVRANRVVALKMLLAGDYASPEARARFCSEAEAVASLSHPNIVPLFEVDEHAGHAFFSMEYCSEGSLAKRLAGTVLPPPEAARLAEQLAGAMAAAHALGIVHRDLKPANVLLTAQGTPKVTDFGIAKRLDERGHTGSQAVIGTPSYMAPEQAAGHSRDVGPAADVYALGAILYEMLTGRPPFKGTTLLDTLDQVRHRDPVAPRLLEAKVPRDLETICLKCLRKDPRHRYPSADELAADLRRFQAGEPIRARPVSLPERGWMWVRRNTVAAALITVSAIFFLRYVLVFAAGLASPEVADAVYYRTEAYNRSVVMGGLLGALVGFLFALVHRVTHALPGPAFLRSRLLAGLIMGCIACPAVMACFPKPKEQVFINSINNKFNVPGSR